MASAPERELEPDERRSWETALSRAGRPSLMMVAGGSPELADEGERPRADLHVVPQREDPAGS